MRLKLFLFTTLFCITNLFFLSPPVAAGCSDCSCGGSCGTVTCNTGAEIQNNNTCGENGAYLNCTSSVADCNSQNYDADDPYGVWCPYGYPNTNCRWECYDAPGTSCVQETATLWCGSCDSGTPEPTPTSGGGGSTPATPTPTGTLTPTPTRTPTPTGTRTPTPSPTPGTVLISGSINEDVGAGLSGSFCRQETAAPLTVDGINLYATNIANTYTASFSSNNFSINTVYAGDHDFTVLLNLSNQTGGYDYVCSCPAAINPDNPYLCRYSGVSSPTSNVNFYLRSRNLSNDSWFQVFGGNFFARNLISSPVPFSFCDGDSTGKNGMDSNRSQLPGSAG